MLSKSRIHSMLQAVLQFIEQRIGVCEQMLTDMLNIKGLDVVTRDEDSNQK